VRLWQKAATTLLAEHRTQGFVLNELADAKLLTVGLYIEPTPSLRCHKTPSATLTCRTMLRPDTKPRTLQNAAKTWRKVRILSKNLGLRHDYTS